MSLIQTAEGGMNQIQEMLIRQRELVIQALNDTNTNEDRAKIQLEIKQLTDEIDSIAHRTEFNRIKVLLGGAVGVGGGSSARVYTELPPYVYSKDYPFTGSGMYSPLPTQWNVPPQLVDVPANDNTKIAYIDFEYYDYWFPLNSPDMHHHAHGVAFLIDVSDFNGNDDDVYLILSDDKGGLIRISVADATIGNLPVTVNPGHNTYSMNISKFMDTVYVMVALGHELTPPGRVTFSIENNSDTEINAWIETSLGFLRDAIDGSNGNHTGEFNVGFFKYEDGNGTTTDYPTFLWIQSGANSGQDMWISLYDCRTETLGIKNLSVLTRQDANQALQDIDNAFGIINGYRATAGSQQNRLEHTMNSLLVSSENLSTSESRIRDADMAKEMMGFVRQNIVSQVAVLMLTQANQAREMVLQLLQ
jgi:flagellin